MKFNLISNITNKVGLQADYEILRARLEVLGHTVQGVRFDHKEDAAQADVNIHLELIVPYVFQFAKEQWSVPNPEWWFQNIHGRHIARINRFLCKTRDAEKIFSILVSPRRECLYMGFRSRDMWQYGFKAERKFLHLVGKSQTKNTLAVINAWKVLGVREQLTLVTEVDEFQKAARGVKGITSLVRVSEEEKKTLLNTHLFHLCPSQSEGFGHYLHEGLSVGAVIITTDVVPMCDFAGIDPLLRVSPARRMPHGVTWLSVVTPDAVAEVVTRAAAMLDDEVAVVCCAAREAYENECADFEANSLKIFGAA